MRLINKTALVVIASAAVFSIGTAQAAVSADKAAQLGGKLTPMGSEKAGNADGTIPAWEGGITRPLASYKAGMFHPDPFAADKPRFTITPANYTQYASQLTVGQQAMFKKYPTFKMVVYPTRRSVHSQRTMTHTSKNRLL